MSGSPEGERITDRSEGARSDWVNRRYTSLHANSSALSGRQGRPPRNTRNLDVVFRSLLINLPVLRTLPRYNLTTRFYVVTYVHRRFYSASYLAKWSSISNVRFYILASRRLYWKDKIENNLRTSVTLHLSFLVAFFFFLFKFKSV